LDCFDKIFIVKLLEMVDTAGIFDKIFIVIIMSNNIENLPNTITLYNPAEKAKLDLIDEFVVRKDVFESIFKEISQEHPRTGPVHYLIVAQRGAGKTTLMYRLKYAIEDALELKDQFIPVSLGEEQYQINSLADLWMALAEILEDYHGFKKLTNAIAASESFDAPDSGYKILTSQMKDKNKKLILFIENFGDLLKKISDAEKHILEGILKTSLSIQIIAGTPISLESVLEGTNVSFNVFKTIELKGLSNDETKALLLKLAEVNGVLAKIENIIRENPQRVEILRRLTGGVIRTMVLLFKIFLETEEGRSLRDLQLILDSVTPLYKHRMDDLPAQQQKIADVVAKNWDAISVKEITLRSKIPSKIVSAQLRQLEKSHVIGKVETDSKNNLYQLKERFFNIWYLMRYGRRYDKKRVTWLVRFFEAWCSKQELEERIKRHIENLESRKYDANSAVLMGEAYVACNAVDRAIKEKLIETTANLYPKEFDANRFDLDDDVVKEAQRLAKEHNMAEALIKLDAVQNISESNYKAIVRIAFEASDNERVLKTLQAADDKGFASKADMHFVGSILEKEFKRFDQALEYYNKAKNLGYKGARISIAKLLYKRLNQVSEGEKILLSLINEEPTNADLYHELGHVYGYFKVDYDLAIFNFRKSIELGRDSSYHCLGALYHFELKDFEMAKIYYSKLPSGEKEFCLGRLHLELVKDYTTAIELLQTAINNHIVDAYYFLGRAYELTDMDELSIKNYDLAFKEANIDDALHRIAHVYSRSEGKRKEAEKYFKQAIDKGDDYSRACLARFYYENETKRKEAVELIINAKSRFPTDPYVFEVSANIMFWDDQFDIAVSDLAVVLQNEEYVERELRDITSLLIKLISKKEYHNVLQLFEDPKVKDILKPIYFALMILMKKDFPNESLKMGDEIKETVLEIIGDIRSREKHNEGGKGRI
jgi:tetratricopeptide (TPR) repeat protein